MAVNVPSPSIFLQQISNAVVALRNDFQTIQNLNAYLTAEGGAAFLQAAPYNLSANDAAMVVATLANLATLAGIYNGATPNQTLNYSANSELLWGGQ
jgi:hypothetical protein